MQNEIIGQGLELMLYGMGTVVLFLALLVIATVAMSRLVERYFPEPKPAPTVDEALRRLRGEKVAADTDAELVAVIGAAVHQHRVRNK